jgi:hypothetical protein
VTDYYVHLSDGDVQRVTFTTCREDLHPRRLAVLLRAAAEAHTGRNDLILVVRASDSLVVWRKPRREL